ncbi:MAG TPA: glycosyltransferase family 2 protein [Candidatus Acidoferrum sp.]|nr:glycosyltransferase family 2 protein [Candidatus Acidoferrum sp.]
MKICAVVPVSPYEPESLITKSIENLKELNYKGHKFEVYYVIDRAKDDNRNLGSKLPTNFKIIQRNNSRGGRAGAINEFLNVINDADYVAIFDVDSRPSKNFIVECIKAFNKNESAVLSSGCRFVTNKNNILTKIISLEYGFFCDLYRLYHWSDGFLQFNGLIGVMQASFLKEERLNETSSCEDLDLTQRIYLAHHVAILAKTMVGEQAPTTVKDLYNQRVRWLRGAVEGYRKFLFPMIKAPIPFSRKLFWFASLTFPFFAFLLSPLLIFGIGRISKVSDSPIEFFEILFGLFAYLWFITLCGIIAIIRYITSSKTEWKSITRSSE